MSKSKVITGYRELIRKEESWELVKEKVDPDDGNLPYEIEYVSVYGEKFPITHPFAIHSKLYRTSGNPDIRYLHFKAMHDYLWPNTLWHDWTERRFYTHCENWTYISLAGGASTAKAQPLWAKVRGPSGWITIGSLKEGDMICDTKGGIQFVTAIHPQGVKDIYKVSFSDGSTTYTTEDHLWEVQSKKQRDRSNGKKHLYTTSECLKYIKRNLSTSYPVEVTGVHTPLPVSPWLLGYFIGNGNCTSGASVTVITPTKTLAQRLASLWPNCTVTKHKNRNCFIIRFRGLRGIIRSYPELKDKKSTEKTIPKEYLYAAPQIRKELLFGILDADGHFYKNSKSWRLQLSNKELAFQCLDLARGLGFHATCNGPKKTYYRNSKKEKIFCTDSWSLYISLFQSIRKKRKIIASIKKVGQENCQCITVSNPNGLYITDDYIVTHNSFDYAKIAWLFWLANPSNRAVVIASTTLDSLSGRIWGYLSNLRQEMTLPLQHTYFRGKPPKVLYNREDTIHGIFAVAAKKGDDATAISNWIGRHPKKGLMLILDEGPDLPVSILGAVPNLEGNQEFFQCAIIGNSLSKFDLHGSLSTPEDGWNSVDPKTMTKWRTTQKNGVCLFFSCYDSPAIREKDPSRKIELEKFLINRSGIEEAKITYGEGSESFYRFILGFWAGDASDETVISESFLAEYGVRKTAHWSGLHQLHVVGGLDPAFSSGGDSCILRLAVLGQDIAGNIVMDYRGEDLLFRIDINAKKKESVEKQIAKGVLKIMDRFNMSLSDLAIDCNGQGRALGEVLRLTAGTIEEPFKIYSVKFGRQGTDSFDVTIKTTLELWTDFREFITHDQIRGLDLTAMRQLTSRLVEVKGTKRTLESKVEYRKRMGAILPSLAKSPDEADSAALALQAAKLRYGFVPGQKREIKEADSFESEKYFVHLQTLQTAEAVQENHADSGMPSSDFSTGLESLPRLEDII
jgi:hypothetical protein